MWVFLAGDPTTGEALRCLQNSKKSPPQDSLEALIRIVVRLFLIRAGLRVESELRFSLLW